MSKSQSLLPKIAPSRVKRDVRSISAGLPPNEWPQRKRAVRKKRGGK